MTVHRKRRIAADEAHSWARNLRLKNPYAKLVLGMLTLYVNGEGVCFVGIEALAEDSELSADTVRKRLAWLEHVGAIARFPQWIDANGKRNSEGRGKRTSDEIRLLMDVDPDVIEARAQGDDTAGDEPETPAVSPSHQQGLNPPSETAGPDLALGQPSDSGKGLTSEPEPEDSPPTPQGGSEPEQVDQGSEGRAWPGSDTWATFEAAYQEPILRQSIARQVWSALNDDERRLAITAARGYAAHRRAQRKPPNVINAHTFLREIDSWPGYAKLAPPETIPPTWIAENSVEHKALRVLFAITGEAMPQLRFDIERGENGYLRRLPVPQDLCGLAVFADKPIEQWGTVERTKDGPSARPFYAWVERIEKWTGHRPEPQRILTGGEHPFTHNGVTTMIKDFVLGLRVPCLYPPRKDGSIAEATGPPAAA